MNSYNQNLKSTVVATLQAQELEQSSMKAQLNAAMFTQYYAEGAKITAQEKLDATTKAYAFQKEVMESANNDNAIAVNLLTTANQQKQNVAQSITNTAFAAANVQIAANAILRLAGDIGSIVNIISAADSKSDIYMEALEVNALIEDTAYTAEMNSKLAMEASFLTSQVSAPALADFAKATTGAVTDLLRVVRKQFESTAALVASDNAALANAFVDEKKAEGVLEDINVAFYASKAAYRLAINELNLNLYVKPSKKVGENNTYTVHFEAYLNPFFYSHDKDDSMRKYHMSPVKDYFIILVKKNNATTFSLAKAEGLKPNQYSKFQHDINEGLKITKHISISDVLDSDGEAMKMGEKYVVFVMVQFNEEYKKTLNNFDDLLTAPSAPFSLSNRLISPNPSSIIVDANNVLQFEVDQDIDLNVEYRCMFLPDNSHLEYGLLTESGLRKMEKEVEKRELIDEKNNPKFLKDENTNRQSKFALDKPGFFFNLLLAQEVPAGNYYSITNGSDTKYTMQLTDNTTDNFGNPLRKGKKYIPVVLCVANVQEENANQYTNSLSLYQDTVSFVYN